VIPALIIGVSMVTGAICLVRLSRRWSSRHNAEAVVAARAMLVHAMRRNAGYLRAIGRGDENANGSAHIVEFPNAIDRQFPNGFSSRAYMAGDVVDGIPLDTDTARKRNEDGGPASV
jgi:hypothetical protein